MAGILSAIKLQEAGGLGGTGRENPYPGIACDIPSPLYCYSFEPNPAWSHHYSPGREIQAYLEGVAHKYGVDKRIRFGAEIVRCELSGGRWQLETQSGDRDQADGVIAAAGVLHHPNVPATARL